MAIWYIDPEFGDDANNGQSWATAWKTISGATSAKGVQAGDEIRIAKSPDPVSIGNATWTNGSATITLATAQTTTIDNCEVNWTPSTNVSCNLTSSYRVQGQYALQVTIDAAFSTGKIAYRNLGTTLNLSSYNSISFAMYYSGAMTSLPANSLRICLCSDTSGNTVVDSFYLPQLNTQYSYYVSFILLSKSSGNLGSSIRSVALYTDIDITPSSSANIYLDNIIACNKNGLHHNSLISMNSNAFGGEHAWYPLRAIDGTSLTIRYGAYNRASGTATTYIKNGFLYYYSDSLSPHVVQVSNVTFKGGYNKSTNEQDGDTIFSNGFRLGYGIYLDSKSGIVFDRISIASFNYGIRCINASNTCTNMNILAGCVQSALIGFHTVSNLNFVTCCESFVISSGAGNTVIQNIKIIDACASGISISGSSTLFSLTIDSIQFMYITAPSSNYAFQISGRWSANIQNITCILSSTNSLAMVFNFGVDSASTVYMNNVTASTANFTPMLFYMINGAFYMNNCSLTGRITISGTSASSLVSITNSSINGYFQHGGSYSIQFNNLFINNCSITYSSDIFSSVNWYRFLITNSSITRTSSGSLGTFDTLNEGLFYNCNFSGITGLSVSDTSKIYIHGYNSQPTDNRCYIPFGTIVSDTTIRHSDSGISWKATPKSASNVNFPCSLSVAKIACVANKQVIIKAWLRRSNTALTARIRVPFYQIGASQDSIAYASMSANLWEEVQLQFTPTFNTVVDLFFETYGGDGTHSAWIDDLTVSQET